MCCVCCVFLRLLTQNWLAKGGAGDVLARNNCWGGAGDITELNEQEAYSIDIEPAWSKVSAGTPMGEPYCCPGLDAEVVSLVERDSNAQELVTACANYSLGLLGGRAQSYHMWQGCRQPPQSGDYEKGKTLKSLMHTYYWLSTVLIARLPQMFDERPSHWLFVSELSPIGNTSALGLQQRLWRETAAAPFKIAFDAWTKMSTGQMSSTDGAKLYSMIAAEKAKTSLTINLLKELLTNQQQQQLAPSQSGGGAAPSPASATARGQPPPPKPPKAEPSMSDIYTLMRGI